MGINRIKLQRIQILSSYLLILLSSSAALAADVYVAPNGNDSNPGTIDKPFQTLEAACVAARASEAGKTIWIKGGKYRLDRTLHLSATDSGTAQDPLVIRALTGHEVIFQGGKTIPTRLWQKLNDPELLTRLPEAARGEVYTACLAGTDLETYFIHRPDPEKGERAPMLAWQGFLLQQARWPNRGYAYIDKVLEKGPTTRWGWDPVPYSYEKPIGGRFVLHDDGPLPSEQPLDMVKLKTEFDRTHDMTIKGYLSGDWYFQTLPIGRIHPEEGSIQLLRYTRYGIEPKKKALERRLYILNALCQLDEPGEWYYDSAGKTLYLWPIQKPSATQPLHVLGGPELISGDGVNHVTLRDITFENFGKQGVQFIRSHHILIAGCTLRSAVGSGVSLREGTNNGITGCDFYDLESAFSIGGTRANRLALIPEHNFATNNHIHHCRKRGYGLLAIGGVGCHFAHNLLHDQNGGMFYGDNDAIIELNEFYNMGYEMGDWNALYNGADLTKINNQVRFNFFHHFVETPNGYPVSAARSDDNGSGLCAIGNIMYKCGRAAVEFLGPNNKAVNNVIMETGFLWWTSQRPSVPQTLDEFLAEKREEDNEVRGTYKKEDIVGKAERLLGKCFWQKETVWTRRYPTLAMMFDFHNPDNNPWRQTYDQLQYNYLHKGYDFPIHMHGKNQCETLDDIMGLLPQTAVFDMPLDFDPLAMFVDPEGMDFTMKSDFKFMQGFQRIPFERIGLYVDEYRKTMPDKTQYRLAIKKKYQGISSFKGRYDREQINRRYAPPAYLNDVSGHNKNH